MHSWWHVALEALFPTLCVACGVVLDVGDETLCALCISQIPRLGLRLHNPKLPYTLIATTSYGTPKVQALIKALKYDGVKKAASTLALITTAAARDTLEHEFLTPASPAGRHTDWLMVPIPLHPKRERERGFNQSTLFAEALQHHEPFRYIPLVHALSRTRYTATQTEKPDYKARKVNVAGCFEVMRPEEVRGKNVLLIEDVTTSGATLEEAARVLKHAGARRITALVFAKA
ncbi:MAG: phosphoribosyltransferase family protein [Candidatus Liptonbacteria bacterium]|nr:phosphoribosyltransferase family protein [Candidatus Liptonbacteria bacterium]